MIEELRNRLNSLPAGVRYVVAAVLVVVAGGALYLSLRAEGPPPDSPYAELVYRKCTDPSCGYVCRDTAYDLAIKGYTGFEGPGRKPRGEGAVCPKCGKKTLEFAKKCPKCGEVHVAGEIKEGKCPDCGAEFSAPKPVGIEARARQLDAE
jgi:rRNA maturation protein Nop10